MQVEIGTVYNAELESLSKANRIAFMKYFYKHRDRSLGSIVTIIVEDSAFQDQYKIKLQQTNLGLSALCWLNRCPSYQADCVDCGDLTLEEMLNTIAGGKLWVQNQLTR